ncbi:MAG: hypothetical protein AAFR90_11630 [Pseudomonadota bacterium]
MGSSQVAGSTSFLSADTSSGFFSAARRQPPPPRLAREYPSLALIQLRADVLPSLANAFFINHASV